MKKRLCFILMLCLLVCCKAHSQTVTQEMALRVAENFFQSQLQSKSPLTISVHPIGGTRPYLYACSLPDRWVLIAGDQRSEPILAYSDENSKPFPAEENMPPAMRMLIEWDIEHIEALRNDGLNRAVNQEWAAYLVADSRSVPNRSVIVSPLLTRNGHENVWGQFDNNDYPSDTNKIYNKFCPPGNNCAHTSVGCVALAMGQIMWYWQWPNAEKTVYNVNCLVNTYDWDLIPYQLTNTSSMAEADMTATLLHNIGISVGMDYGCPYYGGSSAFLEDAVLALNNKYYYNADNKKSRVNYADSTWFALLKEELNEQRPVLYAGESIDECHAFVVDGYNSANEFHVNLGAHGGSGNVSVNLNTIYQSAQHMVTNIHPDYSFYCTPYTVTYTDNWPSNFTVQHGGGITLSVMTIPNGKHGYIYSEDYVKIGLGTTIALGADVYIGIKGELCNEERAHIAAPRTIRNKSTIPQDMNAPLSTGAQKVFRDGQLYIIRGENMYNTSGMRIK